MTRDCSRPFGAGSRVCGDASPTASTAASVACDMGMQGPGGANAEEATQLHGASQDIDPAPLLSLESMRIGRENGAPQLATLQETMSSSAAHLAMPLTSMSLAGLPRHDASAAPRAQIFKFPPATQLPPPPKRVAAHKAYAYAPAPQLEGRMPTKSDSRIALQARAFHSSIARATQARATTDPFPSMWAPCSSSSSSPMLPLSWRILSCPSCNCALQTSSATETSVLDAIPPGGDALGQRLHRAAKQPDSDAADDVVDRHLHFYHLCEPVKTTRMSAVL